MAEPTRSSLGRVSLGVILVHSDGETKGLRRQRDPRVLANGNFIGG